MQKKKRLYQYLGFKLICCVFFMRVVFFSFGYGAGTRV